MVDMHLKNHLSTTGTALKNWFVAQVQDSIAVALLWLVGLLILRVPFALFWAAIGGLCQFIPNFGPLIALIGPVLSLLFSDAGWDRLLYVLILYAVIAVIDGLVLQPYLMRRTAKVPIWASIFSPLILGFVIPFWGVLLAPPLLAIIYAFRNQKRLPPKPEILPPLPPA